jgi:histone H3/H4
MARIRHTTKSSRGASSPAGNRAAPSKKVASKSVKVKSTLMQSNQKLQKELRKAIKTAKKATAEKENAATAESGTVGGAEGATTDALAKKTRRSRPGMAQFRIMIKWMKGNGKVFRSAPVAREFSEKIHSDDRFPNPEKWRISREAHLMAAQALNSKALDIVHRAGFIADANNRKTVTMADLMVQDTLATTTPMGWYPSLAVEMSAVKNKSKRRRSSAAKKAKSA